MLEETVLYIYIYIFVSETIFVIAFLDIDYPDHLLLYFGYMTEAPKVQKITYRLRQYNIVYLLYLTYDVSAKGVQITYRLL